VQSSDSINDNNWHFGAFVYDKDGNLTLYGDNGSVLGTVAVNASAASLANSNADFYIGISAAINNYFGGYIAGIKIDIGNTWTPTQIKTIYDSEAVLFERDALYSYVGQTINYSVHLEGINPSTKTEKVFNESKTGLRETFVRYQKKMYDFNIMPFSEENYRYAEHFLKTVENGLEFSIDIDGTQYAPYKPIDVIKTSSSETISYVGYNYKPIDVIKTSSSETISYVGYNYWKYSFSVREAS
jgi:hypothetical protein